MSHLTPHNLQQLDQLIRMKATGNPRKLARRLEISERSLYEFIERLRKDMGCPIVYSKLRQTYYYREPGKIIWGFQSETSD